jgi:hypothetical protein
MTQKITMGRDKRQDAIDAENAQRQAKSNPFVQGVDAVMAKGPGSAIADTRNHYGNANVMPNEIMQGANSNFSMKDAPGNAPLEDYPNQSGSLDYETSSTEKPETDPESLETDGRLESRLSTIANAASNAGHSLNPQYRGLV